VNTVRRPGKVEIGKTNQGESASGFSALAVRLWVKKEEKGEKKTAATDRTGGA